MRVSEGGRLLAGDLAAPNAAPPLHCPVLFLGARAAGGLRRLRRRLRAWAQPQLVGVPAAARGTAAQRAARALQVLAGAAQQVGAVLALPSWGAPLLHGLGCCCRPPVRGQAGCGHHHAVMVSTLTPPLLPAAPAGTTAAILRASSPLGTTGTSRSSRAPAGSRAADAGRSRTASCEGWWSCSTSPPCDWTIDLYFHSPVVLASHFFHLPAALAPPPGFPVLSTHFVHPSFIRRLICACACLAAASSSC